MNWSTLLALLRTILYGWAVSLWRFVRLLCRLLHRKPKDGPEHRPTSPTDCTPIDHPALVRPDPLLYSQRYLLDRGLAVTWDNPDITLFRGGAPASSSDLDPGTTYDVTVRIWNNSLEAPVIAMPVHLSYLDFGVGNEPIPIASTTADIGVKGSADQPGFVSIPWTTPVTPGHYCLQVQLDPADDIDRSNNLGQENTDVVAAQSPATFTFTLRNNTKLERTYRFDLDGYELQAPQPCTDDRTEPARRLERHRRAGHPVPDGFDVQITPSGPTLAPGDATTITVTAEPPAGFQGRQAINVNAFYDQGFAGGVTLTVVKEP
jgi:hypothetical protein